MSDTDPISAADRHLDACVNEKLVTGALPRTDFEAEPRVLLVAASCLVCEKYMWPSQLAYECRYKDRRFVVHNDCYIRWHKALSTPRIALGVSDAEAEHHTDFKEAQTVMFLSMIGSPIPFVGAMTLRYGWVWGWLPPDDIRVWIFFVATWCVWGLSIGWLGALAARVRHGTKNERVRSITLTTVIAGSSILPTIILVPVFDVLVGPLIRARDSSAAAVRHSAESLNNTLTLAEVFLVAGLCAALVAGAFEVLRAIIKSLSRRALAAKTSSR